MEISGNIGLLVLALAVCGALLIGSSRSFRLARLRLHRRLRGWYGTIACYTLSLLFFLLAGWPVVMLLSLGAAATTEQILICLGAFTITLGLSAMFLYVTYYSVVHRPAFDRIYA